MSQNPYAPPIADVAGAPANQIHLYSPTQAACGALLGGPAGVIYFLRSNFLALGNQRFAQLTLVFGILGSLILIPVIFLLPDNFPSAPFSVAYVILTRHVAINNQVTKQGILDSPVYEFQSNWRVLGLGLLCCLVSVVCIAGPILLFA